jgi:Ca2+-binding EF-hand superfamily protein
MKMSGIAAALVVAFAAPAALAQPTQLQLQGNSTPEQRGTNFDKADANHDGKLDKAEFANTPRAQPPNDPVEIFAASDANHDGVVTRAEFVDGVTQVEPPKKP